MPALINLLNKNKLTLIVAPPDNNPELAATAVAAGADSLVLGINTHVFNDFEEEKDRFEKILSVTKIPVGLAAGWEKLLDKKEIKQIVELGFDFLNVGIEHLCAATVGLKDISKILTLNSRYTLDNVMEFSASQFAAVEAAIIPSSGWGENLTVSDLQNYISIVLSSALPVIVPTQRSIKVSEVAIVADTGAKGLILTSTVCGQSPKHLEKAVKEFRVAVDDL